MHILIYQSEKTERSLHDTFLSYKENTQCWSMVESVKRTDGQAVKVSQMQVRDEAHTVNRGYFPEHTTKESCGFCLFLCLPIKPECLFKSLKQAMRLNRGSACWNSVFHNTEIRLGNLQAAWQKSVRLLLSQGTKILWRWMCPRKDREEIWSQGN